MANTSPPFGIFLRIVAGLLIVCGLAGGAFYHFGDVDQVIHLAKLDASRIDGNRAGDRMAESADLNIGRVEWELMRARHERESAKHTRPQISGIHRSIQLYPYALLSGVIILAADRISRRTMGAN